MSYLYHLEHPNILPLLTSYTYNGIPNFLVPLAEGGDFEHLLTTKGRPEEFVDDVSLWRALSGLASALETLHGYKSDVLGTEMIGFHHDLKPKNVLIIKNRFVLSDFGLSKLKTGEDSRTPFKVGQGFYLAPECEDSDNGFSKGTISRASDVWSLGCIVLEVIVFMVEGSDGLLQFRDRRKFKKSFLTTKTFFCGQTINPAVERQISELISLEDPLLKHAGTLIRQVLVIDPANRLKAHAITSKLRRISYEASYSNLQAAIASVEWRINDLEVRVVWRRVCETMSRLAVDNDMGSLEFHTADMLMPFLDTFYVSKVFETIDSLLNYLTLSGLVQDVASELLPRLRQLEDVLASRQDESYNRDGTHSGAAVKSNQIPMATVSDSVQNLRWNDYSLIAKTRPIGKMDISEDARLIAVEHDWQILIHALPSGEKFQEIKVSANMKAYRERYHLEGHPEFGFLPKGHQLVASWVREVRIYKVGRNETESSVVFTLLRSDTESHLDRTGLIEGPISLAAICPSSKKVALESWIASRSSGSDHILRVVDLAPNAAASGKPSRISIYRDDCVFAFAPDGQHLATSDQKIKRDDGRNAVYVQLIDLSQDRNTSEVVLYCDKHVRFSIRTSRQLTFSVWRGRWVAAVWDPSTQDLTLHDLFTRSALKSFDFSSTDNVASSATMSIFSGNLAFVASHRATGGFSLRALVGSKHKESTRNSITIVEVETKRTISVLDCTALDEYWLSASGGYLILRRKKELKVYSIQSGRQNST